MLQADALAIICDGTDHIVLPSSQEPTRDLMLWGMEIVLDILHVIF